MKHLSVLPGRVRIEIPSLVGQVYHCQYLQKGIFKISGVDEVLINPRTGRILINFDENSINAFSLTRNIKQLLNDLEFETEYIPVMPEKHDKTGIISGVSKEMLTKMVVQAIFTKLLTLLLPVPSKGLARIKYL